MGVKSLLDYAEPPASYMLTQHKNGLSALSLSRQLGVSYNIAWRMKHKLMQAMLERERKQPLS